VRTHDFMDKDLGKAIPYGVYDVAANAGWVNVGTDHHRLNSFHAPAAIPPGHQDLQPPHPVQLRPPPPGVPLVHLPVSAGGWAVGKPASPWGTYS
jgi:hypothetical protein